MRFAVLAGAGVLTLALAGCEGAQAPAAQEVAGSRTDVDAALPEPVPERLALRSMDTQPLRARAETALREQRLHTPAGDNAVEYYLALRERDADTGVAAALAELQPYVLIAAEQALSRQQLDEARRLVGLLARMDTHAPALPRLRESLGVAQERADREEGARIAEAARPPAVVPATPAPSSTVARTVPPAALPLPVPVVAVTPPSAPVALPVSEAMAPKEAPSLASIARAQVAPAAPAAMPRLLRDAAPRYPLAARNRRIEGRVQVAFTIQPDGSVSDVRAVSAQPEGLFEQAALAAASRWQFEPTSRRVSGSRTVTFELPAETSGAARQSASKPST